jgi:hypothetical protein
MKYFGTLGEVKDTMVEAHKTLGQLHLFTKEAAWLLNRNSGGLGSMGNFGSSGTIDTYVNPQTGALTPVTTPYVDPASGTVYDMTLPVNQEAMGVTSSNFKPGTVGAAVTNAANSILQTTSVPSATITAAIDSTATGASTLGSGLTNLFDGLVSTLKSAAGLAVVVGVIYLVYKDGEK